MGIFVDEAFTNITAEVEDCLFVGNYAESFGGGLYLYADGNETHHTFTVRRCNFTSNVAGPTSFGGGLQVAMLVRNFQSLPSRWGLSAKRIYLSRYIYMHLITAFVTHSCAGLISLTAILRAMLLHSEEDLVLCRFTAK